MNAYQSLSETFERTLLEDKDYTSCTEDLKKCDQYYKSFCETFPTISGQVNSLEDVRSRYGGFLQMLDEIDDTIYYLKLQNTYLHPEVVANLEYNNELKQELTKFAASEEFSSRKVRDFADLAKISQEEKEIIEAEILRDVIKENPKEVKEIETNLKNSVKVEDKGKYGELFERTINQRRERNLKRETIREKTV